MNALFIGRFQPFHKGHLKVLQGISNVYNEVIIGIGSSQYRNTNDNPFSLDERKIMIEKTLDNTGIQNYRIISLTDIHDPPNWVDHVLKIVNDFNVVISNNFLTKKLFSEKGYIVKGTSIFEKEKFSGKEIRRRMSKNKRWEELVPKEVVKIIKEINGVQRLKEISE